jgi:hypothetical protein
VVPQHESSTFACSRGLRGNTVPDDIPLMADAMRWLAELGGHAGRPSSDRLGAVTIRRGLEFITLVAIVIYKTRPNGDECPGEIGAPYLPNNGPPGWAVLKRGLRSSTCSRRASALRSMVSPVDEINDEATASTYSESRHGHALRHA